MQGAARDITFEISSHNYKSIYNGILRFKTWEKEIEHSKIGKKNHSTKVKNETGGYMRYLRANG